MIPFRILRIDSLKNSRGGQLPTYWSREFLNILISDILHIKSIWRRILRDLTDGGGSGHSVAQGSYRFRFWYSGHETTQEMRWRYRRKNPESIPALQAVFISILVKKIPSQMVRIWSILTNPDPPPICKLSQEPPSYDWVQQSSITEWTFRYWNSSKEID